MANATDEFTSLFAAVDVGSLGAMVRQGVSLLGTLPEADRARVQQIARSNVIAVKLLTVSVAVRKLGELRPDLADVLRTTETRNWIRRELDVLRGML